MFLILVADPLAVPIQTVEKVIDASKEYFGVKVEPSEKDNEQEVSFGAFSYYDEDEEGSFTSEVRNFCFTIILYSFAIRSYTTKTFR